MSELHTIFTDDDGDGIFDDVHVVNVMNEPVHSEPIVETHSNSTHFAQSNTKSIMSRKQKVKIALVIGGIFFGISLIAPAITVLLMMFL